MLATCQPRVVILHVSLTLTKSVVFVDTTNIVIFWDVWQRSSTISPRTLTSIGQVYKLSNTYTMASTNWDFENIGDGISYFRQPHQKISQDGPSLVVLCTWMSAARKHISKYTQQYRQQYTDADILVVESGVAEMVYRSNSSQQIRLQPARDVLLSHASKHAQGHGQRQAVLHVFSNGGSQCAIQLTTALPENVRRQAFCAITFDSCPGTATYQRTVQALTLSMPKSPLTKYFGPPIIYAVLCLLYLALFVTRAEDTITRLRKQLNDHKLFSPEVPRLYIYSKADQLVPYQDVKSHADDAKMKGYRATSEVLFETSAHCAHAMAHKEQYWQAVGELLRAHGSQASD